MARNNQNQKGQGANRGLTTVTPGQTGRPSEEYATELGAGRTTGTNAGAAGTGQTTRAGTSGAKAREYDEFATELGAGAAGETRKGTGPKKQK